MTTTYGLGFDWARPRSSGARIARSDALAVEPQQVVLG